jgi:hypothetical protein
LRQRWGAGRWCGPGRAGPGDGRRARAIGALGRGLAGGLEDGEEGDGEGVFRLDGLAEGVDVGVDGEEAGVDDVDAAEAFALKDKGDVLAVGRLDDAPGLAENGDLAASDEVQVRGWSEDADV